MKVLHYFLGFPPFRSGGLTKFATDLMKVQAAEGDTVSALWPGKMTGGRACRIIEHKTQDRIFSYELRNPLPVPYDEGILDIFAYTENRDVTEFEDFITKKTPEVMHIHTLMGLPIEILETAKKQNVRIIFSAHDYFGICPRVNLFRQDDICQDNGDCRYCRDCCSTAIPLWKVRLLQTETYRRVKDLPIVKALRASHRSSFFEEMKDVGASKETDGVEYLKLREFYLNQLRVMDIIHFPSSVVEDYYRQYFIPERSVRLSITHGDIHNMPMTNRHATMPVTTGNNKTEYKGTTKLLYLGKARREKGFHLLIESLEELWNNGLQTFELQLYCDTEKNYPWIVKKGVGYKIDELFEIFAAVDILIVPSICPETFGFVVIEALSYGVPVLVSDRVGAKDIIGTAGLVHKAGDKKGLQEKLMELASEKIAEMRSAANDMQVKDMNSLYREMINLYKSK